MTEQVNIIDNVGGSHIFSIELDENGDLLVSAPEGRTIWSVEESDLTGHTGESIELSRHGSTTELSYNQRRKMTSLFKKGVHSRDIAEELGLPVRSIAAYRANWTRSQSA